MHIWQWGWALQILLPSYSTERFSGQDWSQARLLGGKVLQALWFPCHSHEKKKSCSRGRAQLCSLAESSQIQPTLRELLYIHIEKRVLANITCLQLLVLTSWALAWGKDCVEESVHTVPGTGGVLAHKQLLQDLQSTTVHLKPGFPWETWFNWLFCVPPSARFLPSKFWAPSANPSPIWQKDKSCREIKLYENKGTGRWIKILLLHFPAFPLGEKGCNLSSSFIKHQRAHIGRCRGHGSSLAPFPPEPLAA